MTDKSDTIKKKLLIALEKALGVVTTACKNVGIHRSTYYEYYMPTNFQIEIIDSIKDKD